MQEHGLTVTLPKRGTAVTVVLDVPEAFRAPGPPQTTVAGLSVVSRTVNAALSFAASAHTCATRPSPVFR